MLLCAGISVVYSKIDHINHFRVVGWYNAAMGFAFLVMLVFTFHGEFGRNGKQSCMNIKLIRSKRRKLCQKSNIIAILVSIIMIVSDS